MSEIQSPANGWRQGTRCLWVTPSWPYLRHVGTHRNPAPMHRAAPRGPTLSRDSVTRAVTSGQGSAPNLPCRNSGPCSSGELSTLSPSHQRGHQAGPKPGWQWRVTCTSRVPFTLSLGLGRHQVQSCLQEAVAIGGVFLCRGCRQSPSERLSERTWLQRGSLPRCVSPPARKPR